MALFKCKMCGGNIEFEPGATVGTCDHCGTKQTLPKTSDDVVANLFNRANNLRLKCEFDKAEQVYEKIVQQDDSEAEAHWGIVLCKYGIEYVEDPASGKRLPTCHRTLFDAVTADADYQAALDYSDAAQQAIYEAEARAIDRIQRDILSIVKNEKPFDVFICYKETDEAGKRTVDSALANDIYYQLTQEGLKVFYAAITLEDKLGQEYEPYIFAALNSAKVMLVVGTKPEHFNAVWVRNEWSRFLKLMKTDRSKLLIPCYRDMDAYDLPEEFAHLQAQDMGKIGFVNDVVRGIKKVAGGAAPAPAPAAAAAPTVAPAGNASNANVKALLERVALFLEDGKWQDANIYCEKVLDQDPKNAEAYLGKLMAELQVKTRKELANCAAPFDYSENYAKVLRFGDEKLEAEMRGYITHINERNENERLTGIYNNAKNAMNAADTEDAFKAAADTFASISGFNDADALAEQCLDKAEVCRKDVIYNNAKGRMTGASVAFQEEAIRLFQTIPGWKDSNEQIYACQKKIEEIKAKEEAERIEDKKEAKLAAIITLIIAAFIAFVIVPTTVIIPNSKYNAAVSLLNDGKIIDAYEGLIALNGYKDSATRASEIFGQYKIEKLKNSEVGDVVWFGAYEQDNNTSNGKEDVEWIVLAKENGKALVISKYALDCQPYNTSYTDVTWENCSLRKWMNGTFLNNAFSTDEQAKIATTTVSADKNPEHSTNPGNATTDKVFLLSITEAEKYFSSDSARQCKPTKHAVANGAYVTIDNGFCWWWLRSSGYGQFSADAVASGGWVSGYGVDDDDYCVRPAMWIDLNK